MDDSHQALGRRGEALRRAVLRATVDLIKGGGIGDARISEIARLAGIHETSIYRRWGTRDNLVLDAVTTHLDTTLPLPDTGSARTDLIEYFTALGEFGNSPAGRAFAVAAVIATSDDFPEKVRHQFWRRQFTRAQLMVDRGVDRGELPATVDRDLIISTIGGPVDVRILLTHEPVDREFVTRLVDFVLSAVP